jgi:hypothetical protein
MNGIKILLTSLLLFVAVSGYAQAPPESIPTVSLDNVARHGYFYVGGEYVGEPGEETMGGAMYVEVLVPEEILHPYPIVLLHGAGQTGVDWLQTFLRAAAPNTFPVSTAI